MLLRPTHAVFAFLALGTFNAISAVGAEPLRVGVFDVDASPPVGSPLAYGVCDEVEAPLTFRGVVLVGSGSPIVLCAVDWIGIGNEGHSAFREALADAAGTTADRVAVHTLHQHDAPECDFTTDAILAQEGIRQHRYDSVFARDVIARAAEAVARAVREARAATHLGLGQAEVEMVASNRRILGPDGKVKVTRYTATADPAVRGEPVGTIDAVLKMWSLWQDETPLVAITYYATHPQSYYRTGKANPDFPGIARNLRDEATGVMHVHFNGAGGNIGAGKWNDGAHENRQILADRVAAGMVAAWENTKRVPVSAEDLGWESIAVALPPAPHLEDEKLQQVLSNKEADLLARSTAAGQLAWLRRCAAGETVDVACLRLGDLRVLHMPGELFVEYQLAAQKRRPDLFVAMAAYGDYGPGYVGTQVAYDEGGYETGPTASAVAPGVEGVLMGAIEGLLQE
jgi:hypothetical protein